MALRSISDVRVFRQIVASGSIAAAARALGDHKNRVSQRLAALESSLGVRLADRTTRRFRLTEEGQAFYDASEELVVSAERAEAAVAGGDVPMGRVRVSLYSPLVSTGIGTSIARLLMQAPKLELQVSVIDGEADVLTHGIDLAVQVAPLRDSTLIGKHLGDVEYAMAATPRYLARHGIPQTPEDLANHECIRRYGTEPETTWHLLDADGRTTHARLGGRLECSDARMQSDILYADFGIGLRPAAEVERCEREGSLRRVLPTYKLPPVSVWAVCPKGRLRLSRIAPVVELLREAVRSVGVASPA